MDTFKINDKESLSVPPTGDAGLMLNNNIEAVSDEVNMLDIFYPKIFTPGLDQGCLLPRVALAFNPYDDGASGDLDLLRYNGVSIQNTVSLTLTESKTRGASMKVDYGSVYNFRLTDPTNLQFESSLFQLKMNLKADKNFDVYFSNDCIKLFYDYTAQQLQLSYNNGTNTVTTAHINTTHDFSAWTELLVNKNGCCIDGIFTAWTVDGGTLNYDFSDIDCGDTVYFETNSSSASVYIDSMIIEILSDSLITASYTPSTEPIGPRDYIVIQKDHHIKVTENVNNRTNSTAYVLGDLVTYVGAVLECTVAGTSGTTNPFTKDNVYFRNLITDGGVTWKSKDSLYFKAHTIVGYGCDIFLSTYNASAPISALSYVKTASSLMIHNLSIPGTFAVTTTDDALKDITGRQYSIPIPGIGAIVGMSISCENIDTQVSFTVDLETLSGVRRLMPITTFVGAGSKLSNIFPTIPRHIVSTYGDIRIRITEADTTASDLLISFITTND